MTAPGPPGPSDDDLQRIMNEFHTKLGVFDVLTGALDATLNDETESALIQTNEALWTQAKKWQQVVDLYNNTWAEDYEDYLAASAENPAQRQAHDSVSNILNFIRVNAPTSRKRGPGDLPDDLQQASKRARR